MKTLRFVVTALLTLAAVAGHAQSKWAPDRPIRFIVPFAAGSVADTMARLGAKSLGEQLGQTIVVENKPGAGGTIAAEYVYHQPPNGLTLLVGTADNLFLAPVFMKTKFDARKFVPVAGLAETAFVLVGRQKLAANNLGELTKLMRQKPLTHAHSGLGTTAHVLGSAFESMVKGSQPLTHVPFPGTAAALQSVLADQVDISMVAVGSAIAYTDKVQMYGVTASARIPLLSNVPTLGEQGYSLALGSWNSLVAPPGTPDYIADAIASALNAGMSSASAKETITGLGMTPLNMPREEFKRWYDRQYQELTEYARKTPVKE